LFLSLGFGAFLLTVAVASYPLFISAQTTRLVSKEIAKPEVTRYGAGVLYQVDAEYDRMLAGELRFFPGLARSRQFGFGGKGFSPARLGREFSAAMGRTSLLGSVIESVLGPEMFAIAGGTTQPVRLFTEAGAFEHIRRVGSTGRSGVWLADVPARQLNVHPGDRITLEFGARRTTVPVAGVYTALASLPRAPFWQSWEQDIYPTCPTADCPIPTPFAFVDRGELGRLFDRLGVRSASYGWQAPLGDASSLTIDRARSLAGFEVRFVEDAGRPGSRFACCRSVTAPPYNVRTSVVDAMPLVVSRVDREVAALVGPGRVLRVAGILVALAVLATAGMFGMAARRVEGALRFARGTPPLAVGARTFVESVAPGLLGAGAGLGVAFVMARAGPGGTVAASATRDALIGAALSYLVSLVLLAVVSAVAFLQQSELHRERFAALGRVPWELALVAVGGYALFRLHHGGAFLRDPSTHVATPSVYLLLFPVFAMAGLGMVGARLFGFALRWVRGRSARFSSWLYLAVHRLAGGPRVTLVLVAASVLCLGIFMETQTVVRSVQATVDTKAGLFVGSDVEGRIFAQTPSPERFPFPVTRVVRIQNAGDFGPGAPQFDLLTVDPATLASAAYWRPQLSGMSLQDIARGLAAPGGPGVPIVVTGSQIVPSSIDIGDQPTPVHVVARVSGFPGMSSFRPLVVAGERRLARAIPSVLADQMQRPDTTVELWVKGDTRRATAALQSLRFPPYFIVTAHEVKDIPVIAAVIDTFLVLNGLALVAALLVVIGMLMYLQARQRSQVVSYGLSLRMGMSHARHRRSLIAELGAMLGVSYAIGVALSFGIASYVAHLLDPLPTIPPRPLFVSPATVLAATLVGVVAVSWAAAWLTNRRAAAVDLGEVMRLAE
jgi:putative ABC transport system permease protein